MEKQTLLALEERCIQDQPAECVAACPLHLDARSFVGAVGRGDWNGAWKILRKTLPLPGVLGRICDAPCRSRCKRGEAGDPIEIGALERACVTMPAPAFRIQPLPKKGKRVAVVGGAMSGLVAAWDLSRKGYAVHVMEPGPAPGGPLRELAPERLPADALDAELETLKSLGVKIETAVATHSAEFMETCIREYDAVYLDLAAVSDAEWPLDRTPDGRIVVTPKVQGTSRESVFAGGLPHDGAVSVVWQAAEGRWAATSIDRYLQKVSPGAGREREGPYPTRLFTSLEGVAPEPAVAMTDPVRGYSPEEASAEAGRCLQCQCLECVKVCPYLERFGAYPKKYAREIYNNESIVMGVRQANKLINSCSLCGLCEAVCPEDFAMQELCLTARRSMVRREKMPPSAHEFALMDMAFSRGERFAMVRHAPDRERSAHFFFPGCQLCASSPDQVVRVYDHLRGRLPDGVGMMLDCCGTPAYWAGQEDGFTEVLAYVQETWREMGRPRIIAACATCLRTFKQHLPDLTVVSLWQVMVEIGLPESVDGARNRSGSPVAVLDPCTTRYEPEVRSAVRQLLERLNVPVEELRLSGETAECCGFGGLMQNANADVAREVVRRRSEQSERDYAAYCAMCRDNLAQTGKRTLHLLDLMFPDPDEPDPAARPRPGCSERRDNRALLKARLLKEIWKEPPPEMEICGHIRIHITPELRATLDRRRILEEDLRQVIHHAETVGEKLRHPATDRFKAVLKIHNTTFWVEYSRVSDGFAIHNAYAHRMEVRSA